MKKHLFTITWAIWLAAKLTINPDASAWWLVVPLAVSFIDKVIEEVMERTRKASNPKSTISVNGKKVWESD